MFQMSSTTSQTYPTTFQMYSGTSVDIPDDIKIILGYLRGHTRVPRKGTAVPARHTAVPRRPTEVQTGRSAVRRGCPEVQPGPSRPPPERTRAPARTHPSASPVHPCPLGQTQHNAPTPVRDRRIPLFPVSGLRFPKSSRSAIRNPRSVIESFSVSLRDLCGRTS
jgi:hypothetical protein